MSVLCRIEATSAVKPADPDIGIADLVDDALGVHYDSHDPMTAR
jgi:hypothetical protein